jgi:hypothetical protein
MSIADVYRIMGLPPDGSVETIIEPIVDATHADQARAILDALGTVEGGEAREARIHVALETGAIDGDIAFIASQLLAHEALGIPVDLSEFTQEDIDKAQAFLDGQTWTAEITPEVPPAEQNRTDRELNALAEERTAEYATSAPGADALNTKLDGVAKGILGAIWPGGTGRVASYATEAPGAGALNTVLDGVAHPRQAPIYVVLPNASEADRVLDRLTVDRFADVFVRTHNTVTTSIGGPTPGSLGSGPLTAAPTGFAATDEVGITPFAAPAAVSFGTPVSVSSSFASVPQVVHNHVTVSAAVIGSRFDVERAVTKALRSAQRVNGTRN